MHSLRSIYDRWCEAMGQLVTQGQLEQAIERCCAAHPPQNYVLHRDASLLVEALVEMRYRKLDAVSIKVFQGEHLDALRRWALKWEPEHGKGAE